MSTSNDFQEIIAKAYNVCPGCFRGKIRLGKGSTKHWCDCQAQMIDEVFLDDYENVDWFPDFPNSKK
jgi:hypothetical protein